MIDTEIARHAALSARCLAMRGMRLLPILAVALMLLCGVGSATADTWYSVGDPIDPAYLTEMPIGDRSQWIQPWRAYLDTPPATALLDGMGVNFNVPWDQAQVAAQLLAASGIKRARVEISWGDASYSNPNVFANASSLDAIITALRDNGIRPLILLDAEQQIPGPTESFTATLTADAAAGATTVQLDAATAAQVIPGYTGLNNGTVAAGIIFTSVNGNDVATLSQPLPTAFSAGTYPASTLLYQPFAQPLLANGSPNPQFEATLTGWLGYVHMVMDLVTNAYGSANFDVEVWNELGNSSDFLDLGDYYNPLPQATEGHTDEAILAATAAYLHDPSNGWPDVQVGDGFTNQTAPTDDVQALPPGVNAIDKHPYQQLVTFPSGTEAGTYPLNALGQLAYTKVNGQVVGDFEPTYNAFFPEYFLTGVQTETLIREIAPITTSYSTGLELGRDVAPPGGTPPGMWVTETGMAPTSLELIPPYTPVTAAESDHIHAKAALRTYVSFIGKGIQAVDLYAVDGYPQWNLVDPAFFTAAQVGTSKTYVYPGTALGGPVMDAIRRLAATLAGAQTITTPRPLSLLGIASDSNAYQFLGNGTPQFPPLYDRDLLFFQPFQLTSNSWVAAVYVMTRNIGVDLAPENFQITIGGVDAANLTASATDPLTGNSVPVAIISRNGGEATLQMPVTDSPEMVTINDGTAISTTPPWLTGLSAPPSLPASPPAEPVSTPSNGAASPSTRASSRPVTTRLVVKSRLVSRGAWIYLRLECTIACRARWTLHAPDNDSAPGPSHSRAVAAGRPVRIRIVAMKRSPNARRGGESVALTVVNPRNGRKITRHLTVGP